jgi:hypothetical protein
MLKWRATSAAVAKEVLIICGGTPALGFCRRSVGGSTDHMRRYVYADGPGNFDFSNGPGPADISFPAAQLPVASHRLDPAEDRFSPFPRPLTAAIPLMANGPTVNGRALLPGHIGCVPQASGIP